MGKIGGGFGDGSGSYFSSTTTNSSICDLQIAALRSIDNQLTRLHISLENDEGDTDATQNQISALVEELCSLSDKLGTSIATEHSDQ